jgi:hypothetical protein
MKTFKVPDARYLGGLPDDTNPTSRNNARLFISEDGVGVGFIKPTQGKVGWNQMWGSSFDGNSTTERLCAIKSWGCRQQLYGNGFKAS